MQKVTTIKELREALSEFNDEDMVVVEIHEGIRHEDLYEFYIDVIDGIKSHADGKVRNEIRICI